MRRPPSKKRLRPKAASRPQPTRQSAAQLDRLIRGATVDAYGEWEQRDAFLSVLQDELQLPFDTEILCELVTVVAVDLTEDDGIVAVCRRGRERLRVAILDLPLPTPPPEGAQWIAAYRRWLLGS